MDLEEKLDAPDGESPEAEAAPPAKSKKKVFIALGSVVAVLGAALFGAYYTGVFASDGPVGGQEPQEVYPEVNQTLALEPLVIQLADKGRKPRFVRLSLTLGVFRPEEDAEDADFSGDPLFMPRLQDRLIFAVGAKSSQDLGSLEGREALKADLLQEVSGVFPQDWGEVLELYITEMLIQ